MEDQDFSSPFQSSLPKMTDLFLVQQFPDNRIQLFPNLICRLNPELWFDMSDLIVIKAGLPLLLAYKYEDILKGVGNQSKLKIEISTIIILIQPLGWETSINHQLLGLRLVRPASQILFKIWYHCPILIWLMVNYFIYDDSCQPTFYLIVQIHKERLTYWWLWKVVSSSSL